MRRVNLLLFKRNYSSSFDFDVLFIGAGPGGYVGAVKAAQLGLKTAAVEKRKTLGGTCLNVGCIPSKSLLQNSHFFHLAKDEFANRGIQVSDVKLDLAKMMASKDTSVKNLTGGVAYLFKKNKVSSFTGSAEILGENKVKIMDESGKETIVTSKNIVIATGSEVANLPFVKINEKTIVSSTGALSLQNVPKKMVVIGGGVIGLELGSVWSRLGSEVTVVEFLPAIGAGMDSAIATAFTKILQKQGINFKLGSKVTSIMEQKNAVDIEIESVTDGKKETLQSDVVLVAIGRRPNTDGLGLASVGVKMDDKGRIITDKNFETSVPSIYAIGDVINGPMLAHKAEEEGIAVAEFLAGQHGHVNYDAIPSVIYTHPEVAWVGKTEQEVQAANIKYSIGTFPFAANSRAKTVDDAEGFVKVITEESTDRLLGVHILGPNAGELIAEAVLGIEYGASSEDLARTCHAHPTLSEAVKEACLAAHGLKKAINF